MEQKGINKLHQWRREYFNFMHKLRIEQDNLQGLTGVHLIFSSQLFFFLFPESSHGLSLSLLPSLHPMHLHCQLHLFILQFSHQWDPKAAYTIFLSFI